MTNYALPWKRLHYTYLNHKAGTLSTRISIGAPQGVWYSAEKYYNDEPDWIVSMFYKHKFLKKNVPITPILSIHPNLHWCDLPFVIPRTALSVPHRRMGSAKYSLNGENDICCTTFKCSSSTACSSSCPRRMYVFGIRPVDWNYEKVMNGAIRMTWLCHIVWNTQTNPPLKERLGVEEDSSFEGE